MESARFVISDISRWLLID